MALLMTRNTVENYAVILFTIVLGTMASDATEAIPGYTFIILSSMVILIVPKVLYNIIVIVK